MCQNFVSESFENLIFRIGKNSKTKNTKSSKSLSYALGLKYLSIKTTLRIQDFSFRGFGVLDFGFRDFGVRDFGPLGFLLDGAGTELSERRTSKQFTCGVSESVSR